MRKFVLVGLAALVATMSLVALAEVPEKITIADCVTKKAAVEFNHKAHIELADCVACHHTSEGLTAEKAAGMEVAKCGSCHVTPEKAETPVCSSASMKTNPYHILCVTCHKEAIAKNAESKAPDKCVGCHPKAE